MPDAIFATIRDLFAHSDWARDKLLAAAAPLTAPELERPFEIGSGSLHAVLKHLYGAEKSWLESWRSESIDDVSPPDETRDLAELGAAWRQIGALRLQFLQSVAPEHWREPISYSTSAGDTRSAALTDLFLHVCNHGVHHRAQALNCLRHLGAPLAGPGLDYLFYRVEHPTVLLDENARAKLATAGLRPAETALPATKLDHSVLERYFEYSRWATQQVIAAASDLPDQALDRAFEIGLGTLRATILHICDAEQWWQSAWEGEGQPAFEKLPKSTPLPVAAELFVNVERRRRVWLKHTGRDRLQEVVEVVATAELPLRFRVGEALLQLCTHGTHHRAQALNMLRQLGQPVPQLDFVHWIRERERNAPT